MGGRDGIRGLIEGFYGPPWSWEDRAHVMAACHRWGMTHYVYAPKDDPLHRERWREPYPAAEVARLAALAAAGTLEVGFAISPGLSMDPDDAGDRAALAAKVDQVVAAGIRLVCLCLDDIPVAPGLGPPHARLTSWLAEHLAGRAEVVLVPTEYTGQVATPYLEALAAGVPADVPIAWTGDTVVCDEITPAQADQRAAALGGRPPLLWDNYPVNDSVMGDRLLTGPVRGRPAGLPERCSGWLANPMVQPRASLPALASVAGLLRGDDAEAAWRSGLAELGVATFAEACDGEVPRSLVAAALAADGPHWGPPVGALDRWLREAVACGAPGLEDEVGPWLAQVHADAGLARRAVRLLQAARPVVRLDDRGRGRAAGPDHAGLAEQAMVVAASWQLARRAEVSVLGPRCSLRPVIAQWPDGTWAYRGGSVQEGANALDDLVRGALDLVGSLDRRILGPLEVSADGAALPVGGDGAFAAPPGVPVTVTCGTTTRVAPGEGPPLPDRRLDP